MAHRTLISGTGYDISGGREMIGGTGYTKKKGRVLVNGTGYDLSFGRTVTVTTKNKFEGSNLSKSSPNILITCNGVTYTVGPQTAEDQANKTFTAKTGDSVTLSTSNGRYYSDSWSVTLPNGKTVGDAPATFALTADTTIEINGYSDASGTSAVMCYRTTVRV